MAPEKRPEDVFEGIAQSLRYGYGLASWVPKYLRNFADKIEGVTQVEPPAQGEE